MPALRHRPSRTSTPINAADTPTLSTDQRKSKTQSSLDAWIEPPVQKPVPSFEDHGFARQGVLQGMSPLGVGPSAKVKQRLRALDSLPPSRVALGKNGNNMSGEEGVSTPELTPARDVEQEDSERQDEDEMMSKFQPHGEEEDDDYMPNKPKVKPQAAASTVRGKPSAASKSPATAKTPAKNGLSRPSAAIISPPAQNTPHFLSDLTMDAKKQRLTIIVNEAISRGHQDGKPALGAALRQLHLAAQSDHSLQEVLDAILRQNPTLPQLAQFRVFIKDAKKRYKRGEKLRREEAWKTAASAAAPWSPTSPASPPQQSFVESDVVMEDAAQMQEESTGFAANPTHHPLSTAPVIPPNHSPSPLPSRMSSKSPRKRTTVNGDATPAFGSDKDVVTSKAPTPTVIPSDSVVGSDSELSDVNEEIVQKGPPPKSPERNGIAIPEAIDTLLSVPPNVLNKKEKHLRQLAAARDKKNSRANSAKPNGKHEKRPAPSAKDIAEDLELQRKRQAMSEQQLWRSMEYDPPLSRERYFDDEKHETESLTESQIAVGPPIEPHQPRRPERASRGLNLQLGKRVRDDSSRVPSPQPGSAGTSRPSTPAGALPPAKRLKLNIGQTARTKRSPVKNRDGPIIAGIPHTGGGGSRQLGPDDNSPGSPSESDDWCAACRGAGEFVCCEGCPRVFHYLCCDPPRLEPPDGSFYCHECTGAAVDEPGVEGFRTLRPLFKALESTNTRSFALPNDLQTYYENVKARDDGSYHEETKKFPLSKNSGYGYQRPDYLRTHDADQRAILCVQCGKSSAGKRQMLKCDFCHAYWHLDCCSPPLANPPHISLEASQRDAWKCPRHVDHDLRSGLLLSRDVNAFDSDDDIDMADAISAPRVTRKLRKPRSQSVVEPVFSRGLRNNGIIDIINDPDDDTDGEGNYVFEDLNSKTFRVPEKGVILDFITKVKSERDREQQEARRARKHAARRRASQQQFASRSLPQQQAALHLAQLARRESDLGLNETSVDALYLSLTAEAPKEVVSAMENSEPSPMTEKKRTELLKLRELIDRALEG